MNEFPPATMTHPATSCGFSPTKVDLKLSRAAGKPVAFYASYTTTRSPESLGTGRLLTVISSRPSEMAACPRRATDFGADPAVLFHFQVDKQQNAGENKVAVRRENLIFTAAGKVCERKS